MIVLFNWFITFEIIQTIYHEPVDVVLDESSEMENEIEDEKFEKENLLMNMILFPTSMSLGIHTIASITTLLLCSTESSERNNYPTN